MSIALNPIVQAEMEMRAMLAGVPGAAMAIHMLVEIVKRAIMQERLMMGQHEDCGADNPKGTAALCKCYCHKGHYRHVWIPVIKTPNINTDGSYHLIDRCKFCPDVRFQVIKPEFIKEMFKLVSSEFLIRGTQQVLTKEAWLESRPEPAQGKLLRRGEV